MKQQHRVRALEMKSHTKECLHMGILPRTLTKSLRIQERLNLISEISNYPPILSYPDLERQQLLLPTLR